MSANGNGKVSTLRQKMTEDLQIRNYSPHTIEAYIRCVANFAKHFGKSPDLLTPDHVRQYQLFLVQQRQVSWARPRRHCAQRRNVPAVPKPMPPRAATAFVLVSERPKKSSRSRSDGHAESFKNWRMFRAIRYSSSAKPTVQPDDTRTAVSQNSSFSVICRMRGSRADVILPKFVVPTVAPGLLKLTLLNTLKNSARNCILTRSVSFVSLIRPRSVLKNLGPRRMFLPEFPNVPRAFVVKSDVLKNRATIWACDCPLSFASCRFVPMKSARSPPTALRELSTPLLTLNGNPVCHVVTEVSSQPWSSRAANP